MSEISDLVESIHDRLRSIYGLEPPELSARPNEEDIDRAEQDLGQRLPPSLRAVYESSNGFGLGACNVARVTSLKEDQAWGEEVLTWLREPLEGRSHIIGETGTIPAGPVIFFGGSQPLIYAIVTAGSDLGRIHALNYWSADDNGPDIDPKAWDHIAWSLETFLACHLDLIDNGFFTTLHTIDGEPFYYTAFHEAGVPREQWLAEHWPAVAEILNKWKCGLGTYSLIHPGVEHLQADLTWSQGPPQSGKY